MFNVILLYHLLYYNIILLSNYRGHLSGQQIIVAPL